jgi:hypothetical protein
MSTFWLTFKPFDPVKAPLGWPVQHFKDLLDRFGRNPMEATEWWRFAAHKKGKVGDRILLFKQGVGARGIFGVGTIIEGPAKKKAPTDHKEMWRVLVRFEKLVDPTKPNERFLIPLKGNEILFPATLVEAQASGTTVPDAIAAEFEQRCRGYA